MNSAKSGFLLLIFLGVFLIPLGSPVSQVDVLVVDDGHNLTNYDEVNYQEGMFRDKYLNSLNSIDGVNASLKTTAEGTGSYGPSAEKMSNYDLVIWYTLSDRDYGSVKASRTGMATSLYPQDRQNIREYLNKYNGSFFMTGHRATYDLKGKDFFNNILEARVQEPGSNSRYYRYTVDEDDSYFTEVFLDPSPYIKYNEEDDLILKGRSVGSEDAKITDENFVAQLDTAIEPPGRNDFKVVVDNCRDQLERDNRCNNAQDNLRWGNNINENSDLEKEVQVKKEKKEKTEDSDYLRLPYEGSKKDNEVIMAVLTYNEEGSTDLEEISLDNGKVEKIKEVDSEGYSLKTYILRSEDNKGHIDIYSEEEISMSGITVALEDVPHGLPVKYIKANTKEAGEFSTSVESESGQKIVDFLATDEEVNTDSDQEEIEKVKVENNIGHLYSFKKDASSGSTEMGYKSGKDYTHVVLSVNKDRADAEYQVDTEEDDYLDDYSQASVRAFNEDFRTLYNSFGFEAIRENDTRKDYMENAVRYLTGPVSDESKVYSGEDISYTPTNESRYTQEKVNISAKGLNLVENPSDISNARYFYSKSSTGLRPTLQDSFENDTVFQENWDYTTEDGGRLFLKDYCGVKKGQKAMILSGTDEPGVDLSSDKVTVTSKSLNLSNSVNHTVEFWARAGSRNCDEPDNDEDLVIQYKNSTGWHQLDKLEPSDYEGSWSHYSKEIRQDYLSEDFRIRIVKEASNIEDRWLVDEFSFHSSLKASDGDFDESEEKAEIEGVKLDDQSLKVDPTGKSRGVNVTFGIQFKDDSRQGYWGIAEQEWVVVDTEPPNAPSDLSFSSRYVNDEIVNISIDTTQVKEVRPDLVHFTCDDPSNDNWSKWKERNRSKTEQEFHINITSERMGCSQSDGNRTITVEVRDYAGNKPSETLEDWIVYDTEKPDFEGEIPGNESTIQFGDQFFINASDEFNFTGDDRSSFFNTQSNRSFTPNESFDPAFGSQGDKDTFSWIRDRASNFEKIFLEYDVDTESPGIQLTPELSDSPENGTAIQDTENIEIDVFDRNFDDFKVSDGSNTTFSDNGTFTNSFAEGEDKELKIWAFDKAGNVNYSKYFYTIDGTSPSIDNALYSNDSFIQNDTVLEFNLSDSPAGIKNYTKDGYSQVPGTPSDIAVDPGWSTEGNHSIEIGAYDKAGNRQLTTYNYSVDETPPDVFSNYTSSSWRETNATVSLEATDNFQMDKIFHCTYDSDESRCNPDTYSDSGSNVTLDVGCREGSQCSRYVVFNGNDSAGLLNSQNPVNTSEIRIDKKKPEVKIEGPPEGSEVSGTVDLEADISDSGVGLEDANYTVYNATDPSQVFVTGDLNSSNNFTYSWDSENDIAESEKVTLKVEASDSFEEEKTTERNFTVDNLKTTVTILNPNNEIVGEDFDLKIRARRTGEEDLKVHNYSIEDDGSEIYSNSTDLGSSGSHLYDLEFNTSQISDDGNYTLNTTALSTNSEYATEETTFYLDREAPNVTFQESINDTWQTGEITVDYFANDSKTNETLYLRWRDDGASWNKRTLSYSSQNFTFDTGNCDDDNQSDCVLQLVAEDSVPNKNKTTVYLKVDNSPPTISYDSPQIQSWQNGDFTIERTVEDNVVDESTNIECREKVGSSSYDSYEKGVCDKDIEVDIPGDCGEGLDSCEIKIQARPVFPSSLEDDDSLKESDSAFYSIDTGKPEVLSGYPIPGSGSVINDSENITVKFEDEVSGVQYSYWDDGSTRNPLTSGESFEPTWATSGEKELDIELNDSADNLLVKTYEYTFDREAPEIKDVNLSVPEDNTYSEIRVYRGESVKLDVNASDNFNISEVKATVNSSSPQNETLQLQEGSKSSGVWELGLNRNSTGFYNITDLYVTDEADNTTYRGSGLPSFRVVNYSQSLEINGTSSINATFKKNFTYSIDFNRTQGSREFKIYIPPSDKEESKDPLYNLSSLECSETECNVSDVENYLNVSYNGSEEDINITGDIKAFSPENDRSTSFKTYLKDNERSSTIDLKAPDLLLYNLSCVEDCTVNQSANFSLNVSSKNNRTSEKTGEARQVDLELSSDQFSEKKDIGDLGSGLWANRTFENLSIDEVGNFTVDAVIEDAEDKYNASDSIEVEILDDEKPVIKSKTLEDDRINVNESLEISANLTDNVGVDRVNYTLEYPDDTKENLTLNYSGQGNEWNKDFNDTSQRGVYNLTYLYVFDERNNSRVNYSGSTFEVSELEINAFVNETDIERDQKVSFSVNVSGNSSEVSEIQFNITKPLGGKKIKEYTDVSKNNSLNFSDFTNSGNYSFDIEAFAGLSVAANTSNVSVDYGNSSVYSDDGNQTELVIPSGQNQVNLTWKAVPNNGGLRNATLDFSSNDTSVLETVSSSKDIGNLTYENGARLVGLLVSPDSDGYASLNASLNPEKGRGNSAEILLKVKEDNSAPEITNSSISEQELNINETVVFEANVTDNSALKNVTLNVDHPENGSGITEKFKMNRRPDNRFVYSFENSTESGDFNYSLKVWDAAENLKQASGNFSVTDDYDVGVDFTQGTYVKGEFLEADIEVEDANGEEIENYESTVILDDTEKNTTLNDGTDVEEVSHRILTDDPPESDASEEEMPVDYTLYVNVSNGSNGNFGGEMVEVTRILDTEIGVEEDFVDPGGEFTVEVEWFEPTLDPIGNDLTTYANCDECQNAFKSLEDSDRDGVYTQTFTAPDDEDSVLVQGIAFDNWGNSESGPTAPEPAISVEIGGSGTTSNESGDESAGGGFSGGAGAGPSMEITRLSPDAEVSSDVNPVNISVGTNIAAECYYSRNPLPSDSLGDANSFSRTGGVTHTQTVEMDSGVTYSFNIRCLSDAANATEQIIFSKGSDLGAFRPTFPTSLTQGNETIVQSSSGSETFTVFNNGSEVLGLEFETESECCNSSVKYQGQKVDSIELESGETAKLSLSTYVPLSVERGVHEVLLTVRGDDAAPQRSISFTVSRHPKVEEFRELLDRARILNSSIERYDIVGIDTRQESKRLADLMEKIDRANRSIMQGDLEGLESSVSEGKSDAQEIDRMLENAEWKKYLILNWWKWALAFVILYMVFFMITIVGIPYYRIKTELMRIQRELDNQVEARKKGEKQYFKRQIDKDTFNEMMQERQNRVLELRGQKEDLNEELDGFLWERMTLENYLKAPWKGMEEIEKFWAANRKARKNLKGGNGEDSDK